MQSAPGGSIGLEVEARTERDDATRETLLRPAKIRARDIVGDAVGLEVQVVKHVVRIHTELDLRVFSKHWHVRKTESLGEGKVQGTISRSVERVPSNAR